MINLRDPTNFYKTNIIASTKNLIDRAINIKPEIIDAYFSI